MFWIGIVPAVIGLVIRLKMPESAMWLDTRNKAKQVSMGTLFKNKRLVYEIIMGILAMTGIAWVYGLTLGFFPTVLSVNGFLKFPYFIYVVITAILVSLVGYVLSGYLSDIIGRRMIMIIFSVLAIIAAIPMTFLIMRHDLGFTGSLIFASVIAFLTTGIYGVIPAFLSEKYPTEVRSTGTGLGFNGGFILGNWSTVFLLLIVSFAAATFFEWWGIFVIIGELFILVSALLSRETRGANLSEIKL
ncbi:MAG: proline/betaine transport permease [Thermoplasmatales archaeon A-plasma]|nr:MAG: proline/betaine transport permease [Thermoplasmatales archaeon A-plasma]